MKQRSLVGLAIVGILALAGCGSSDGDEPTTGTTEATTNVTDAPVPHVAIGLTDRSPANELPPDVVPGTDARNEGPTIAHENDGSVVDSPPTASGDVGGVSETSHSPDGSIIGIAEAIESAVIVMSDGTRVMLYGVESVYPPQDNGDCRIEGEAWGCWAAAFRALQTLLAEGGAVTCVPQAPADRAGRELAICTFHDGRVLNEEYVRSGFALAIEAEMPGYLAVEDDARAAQVGLWQGTFIEPAIFRASHGILPVRP